MESVPPSGVRTELHDGFSDHLEPTMPLDLAQIHGITDLVQAMSRTAFGGRNVGEAADVLYEMVTQPECFVVGTFSGAMTVAKMGLVLCDMIEQGMLQAVITTGALMAHGFVEASGRVHFKYYPSLDDKELYYRGYDRFRLVAAIVAGDGVVSGAAEGRYFSRGQKGRAGIRQTRASKALKRK